MGHLLPFMLSENQLKLLLEITSINPLPKRQILDSSKLKEFADDNFEFDEILAESSQNG